METALETKTPASVRALLIGAIDYAGLFPPAGLSMPEAVINYATYRNSNYNWMLGRFVVTAARLGEFYDSARDFISRDGGDAWHVAVVVGDETAKTIAEVKDFNAANGPGVICDVLEIKADSAGAIENAARSLGDDLTAYFELALNDDLPDMISTLALQGQRAKIRTGGLTPDAFPKTDEIIRFVRACLAANVPFKATAGLHHPIRCFRPLTYEANSPTGTMHGFLNLFLMTGFAMEGYRTGLLEDVMEEEFDEVFEFVDQSAIWREQYTLNTWQIERLRKLGIQSFGSCSFDEPVADLQKLGIL
ncbi:MAG: hypothetical protein JO053_16080 [Acidobacteria bacterium]|nr:hypothetical protein [Acidobacteriota bacterium]